MRTRPILIAAALCLLGASSCIEFESQTLTFRYDNATDTLRIFQLYEGIYGNDSQDSLSVKEAKQMASVLNDERTFFFANWIFECSKPQLEQFVAQEREKQDDPNQKPREKAAKQELVAFAEMLLANVQIENGPYFLNAEQKLSGYQLVTVENASKVVDQANRAISFSVLAWPPDDVPPASRRRILEAAGRGYQWIRLDGNSIRGRFPFEHADAMTIRRQIAGRWASTLALKQNREQRLANLLTGLNQLLQSDIWASYIDDTFQITVGHPRNPRTELSFVLSPDQYKPNVVPFAKTHGGIAKVSLATVRDAFLAGK